MGRQYVVAYFPDGSQVVEGVGPFRSEERAREVARRLDAALDPDGERLFGAGVQVVWLGTLDDAIEEHGLPASPEGGEQRG